MEHPQPRPFGTEGRKPTHDFLSLYSPVQQDPRPSQGVFLRTHDFLQPLERVGKNTAKEENKVERVSVDKTPQQALPASVEHLLPGGIGTYTISYFNNTIPKAEGSLFTVSQANSADRNDENSNCSSYSGSGFTLWEECAVKKGKTGKENIAGDGHSEEGMKIGGRKWSATSDRPSQSFSTHSHPGNTFSRPSSSQPTSSQKNHTFMDMIKSAKSSQHENDDNDDDFVIKKEPSPHHRSDLTVHVDARSTQLKPNTPRSKHSATEQRRRSKINDRFQMLRGLIPNSDQKRDKASFLLEVIEYIQYLQEKVQKYEGSFQGWNHELPKLMTLRNSHRPADGFVDQSQGTSSGSDPVLMIPTKFDANNLTDSATIPRSRQNGESDMSTATTFKRVDHNPVLSNKNVPFSVPRQPNIFHAGGSSSAQFLPRQSSDTENIASQPSSQLWQTKSCTTDGACAGDKMREQELTVESGTISISSVYSQGLLNTLTQALQSTGVDLSQASISVQIDLGKRTNSGLNSSTSTIKNDDIPSSNHAMPCTRVAGTGEESGQPIKRLKTRRN